ncbi:MAG: hypothetical protein KGO53_06505 [Alphaproteobacteria bacterium]|nr:hypothetical protein [Alphaproteobacteria bacterium]
MPFTPQAILAAGLLLGVTTCQAWADPMSADEIKKLAPGTYNVSVADSVRARVVLTAKGGISVTTDKGEKDSGHWTVNGTKACVLFKHLLDHKPYCSTLTRDGSMLRGDGFTIRF